MSRTVSPTGPSASDGLGEIDVLVVGAGAAGMLAAIASHDAGLRILVIEKSAAFGGTSARSGGQLWIPCHHLKTDDTRADAFRYLKTVTDSLVSSEKLETFLDEGPQMLRYLEELGIELDRVEGWPDYFPDIAGAGSGRSVVPSPIWAGDIGEDLNRIGEQPLMRKLFGRIALDTGDLGAFSLRLPGWRSRLARRVFDYLSDVGWRIRSRRDRRLTMGNALVGGLVRTFRSRGIPIRFNAALVDLVSEGGRITGCRWLEDGRHVEARAKAAVLLAAGGFEHDQAMRDKYLPVGTDAAWSFTPGTNDGGAIKAGLKAGARMELAEEGFWLPTVRLPSRGGIENFGLFRMPHSICVTQAGQRFLNESASYDQVGNAMVEVARNGAGSVPCWFVFDRSFREKYACGGLMPAALRPDWTVPGHWWDRYVYRAATIDLLAEKIGVPSDGLGYAVAQINEAAVSGRDPHFQRGGNSYDRAAGGDPRVSPNPSLGTIDRTPFYAVRMDLGDLGSKGGLSTDHLRRVVDKNGRPIEGLFAFGDSAAAPFGREYPGPGASLGPALTSAYGIAKHLARQVAQDPPPPKRRSGTDQSTTIVGGE